MTSPIVRCPSIGCIVELMHSNKPLLAWVLEEQNNRFRVLTINRREMKLPAARLLPWSGPAASADLNREEIMERLRNHEERRVQLISEIDPAEIWNFSQGEVERASSEWFAGLLWNEPDIDQIAAMGRVLLEHKSHFKFTSPDFEVFPEEVVEKRLREQAIREEREKIAAVGQKFFQALWNARTKSLPAPKCEEEMVQKLRDVLFAGMVENSSDPDFSIWNSLKKGLPDTPHLALLLAQTWGIVPAHYNVQLLQEGYDWGDEWGAEYAEDIADLKEKFAQEEREPEATPFVSIDSASTRDIDDAFYITQLEDGTLRLQVALACPCLNWEFESRFDRAIRDRASSLYLPEGTSHMLPETLGLGLYSLLEGEARPALIADFLIKPTGEVMSMTPRHAWVRLASNTTYETVEAALEDGSAAKHFVLAAELGKALRDQRIAAGAVILQRPDPKIVLEGEGDDTRVSIVHHAETPKAQLLVSEFMILANSALGHWANERSIPLLYRTQDVTFPGDAVGIWEAPEETYRVVRHMAPTCLEVEPKRHATLAVTAYSPITSPLRRYVDLLNMSQVTTYLRNDVPDIDAERLLRMVPLIVARVEAVGRLQRYRPRYWKLVYFSQRKHEFFSSVVVDDGPLVTVALPQEQLYLRAPQRLFGEKIYPGQHFAIRLNKINPLLNEIRIVEALEE